MSNIAAVPEELNVGRGDPVYMAHGYLTKVPVTAIMPFLEAHTKPGQVVLDPFAGSGMTGAAALALGRTAELFDISVLGQHIGSNYTTVTPAEHVRKAAAEVIEAAAARLDDAYGVECERCESPGELAKTVWSVIVECGTCGADVNYYDALEAADWSKPAMACPKCDAPVTARLPRVGEAPVLAYVGCDCSKTQIEQKPTEVTRHFDDSAFPNVEIPADRQMYKASALGKHGLTTVGSFYSERNRAVLATLHDEIMRVEDAAVRGKLLFAFTGSLTRASKRYQWSKQRPLNAANANYYVAPVFYEWNVFQLFERKVEAAIKSDDWLRSQPLGPSSDSPGTVTYRIASAERLPLDDGSIDYVFTDPPFGSNLFYADMALFQEAWLRSFTDVAQEAVVDRGTKRQRDSTRYESLLTAALSECRRVLKPSGRVSMVFGNSSGAMWALVQRAIAAAGLEVEPDRLVVLNKGQRSVKGLASGFEHVATLDLILTMKPAKQESLPTLHAPDPVEVEKVTRDLASTGHPTPSHLYLELLRHGIRHGWDLSKIDLRDATAVLLGDGWTIDSGSGRLAKSA